MQLHGIYTLTQLEAHFGPVVAADAPLARTAHDLLGDFHQAVLAETVTIVAHQWQHGVRRGAVKGFFLGGPPGVGKTALARRAAYELALRFRDPASPSGESPVVLVLIDGAEIARARYGESEERIREVFHRAQKGFTEPGQRSIVLFDDVESVLMRRGASHSREWHFSQDSVFFHAVDDLDTSRTAVFLTSNRPDLVDEAILDRFLNYTFMLPSRELLVEVAARAARAQGFSAEQLAALTALIERGVEDGTLRSIREAERLVVRAYVERILGRASAARIGVDGSGGQ